MVVKLQPRAAVLVLSVLVAVLTTPKEVYGATLIESPALSFSEIEARAIFDAMNFGTRYRAAQTSEKIRAVLIDTFRQALIAQEAERIGIAAEPINTARVQRVRQAELARIALDRKRQELLAKLPDFTRQAAEIYKASSEEFVLPEQVDVGHILFRVKTCEAPDDQRAKLQAILERLRVGASFEDLARELSDDKGSAGNGGRLGLQKRGTFIPAFEQTAFNLKESGQISDIVETEAGLHLIKLYDHQAASQIPFENAKPDILKRLEGEYLQREINQWQQSLWDAQPLNFDDKVLDIFIQDLQNSLPKLELPDSQPKP